MHDTDIITIWFWSVSAGVLLTLLMTQMASAPGRRSHAHNPVTAQLEQDAGNEQRDVLVHTAQEPALTLVSTSWAWGIPQAVPDQRARDQDQAA
ncbi:exported hypothetical protein [Candidatus Nitrospira nitrosa]|uniref:Uncharacterized protein n=1 Tax=Candidatus Nitrospira nitrosa TaxID=1742972 RepID=A0A0S4LA75_9BACT|nr:hypothetical protein [Candidatus Nitrospira nitrosa]CUS33706.1 exported hypothetical protein [Candidatus Nitrospira nitrosa]